MRLRALLVLVFMVVLISPLVLADEEEEEYEAGYGSLAEAGIGLIAVGCFVDGNNWSI